VAVVRGLLRRRRAMSSMFALRPATTFRWAAGRIRVDDASPGETVCGAARSAVKQVCLSTFGLLARLEQADGGLWGACCCEWAERWVGSRSCELASPC
jgi:hypothetical protein